MSYTKLFTDINKSDVAIAGGKGASLGEMTQAGIPVPPGFVVTAQSFDEFLKETDLNVELDAILDNVDHEAMHTVDDASEKIKALIMNEGDVPEEMKKEIVAAYIKLGAKFVAVRSSATSEDSADAAWAGQLESYLNVTEDDLIESVKKCWASLFTPRAIFYRFEKGLHDKSISVAVVVQKMVESEVSGIAFSVHPVTQDRDQMIIEAGFGLGEAIVSGSITPDSYVVEKSNWNILDKNITVQERGIYRSDDSPPDKGELEGVNQWQDIPKSEGEKPTLTDDQVIELSKLVVKIEKHYGFPVDVEWAKEGGKFYIVQSRPITTLGEPITQDDKYSFVWGESDSMFILEATMRMFTDARHVLATEPKHAIITSRNRMVRAYFREADLDNAQQIGEEICKKEVSEKYFNGCRKIEKRFEGFLQKLSDTDLEKSNSDDLVKLFESYMKLLTLVLAYYQVTTVSEYLEEAFKRIRKRVSEANAQVLVQPSKLTELELEEIDFIKLSLKEKISVEDILDVITNHSYLAWNSYNEEDLIDYVGDRVKELQKKSEQERREKIEEIEGKKEELKKKQKYILSEVSDGSVVALASMVRNMGLWRFRLKKYWAGAEFLARELFIEITRRLEESMGNLMWVYSVEDVVRGIREDKRLNKNEVANRQKSYSLFLDDGKLSLLTGEREKELISKYINEPTIGDEGGLKGVPATKGRGQGEVKVVCVDSVTQLRKDMEEFKEGQVLVTTMTQVNVIPIMKKAVAILTEQGGITSHAAIISRELDKPCIVGVDGVTQILKDGDEVEVDADKGVVKILMAEA